jgi:cyclase
MLKRRVIPTLLLKGAGLVKGTGFDSWRTVGSVQQAVRVFEARMVDELILLDIGATPEGRGPDIAAIADATEACFMPLTAGGGVRSVEDFRALLLAGADKVAICTAALERPALIAEASRKFGAQCVVVAIDVRHGRVAARCGEADTGLDPVAWAREAERLGAGEILLSSVERDGTMQGYDLELIRSVARAVRIPVVASGGAGCPADFEAAFSVGADAVAAGAVWQFSDLTPMMAKHHLAGCGIPVRL